MTKIQSLIVDDEPGNVITLQELLREYCPEVNVLGSAENPIEAQEMIRLTKPDLVFLDIEMPYGNAFDLLDKLKPIQFEIIFITAFNDYAIKAFKYAAVDYILKPVNIQELKDAVQKVINKASRNHTEAQMNVLLENLKSENSGTQKIALPNTNGIYFEVTANITYLKAEGNYTQVNVQGKRPELITKPLRYFEDILSDKNFCRIHNSYIININFVKHYFTGRGGYVEMQDGQQIDVSVRKKEEFLRKYTV